MADPLQFRDAYKTAVSVTATKVADAGFTTTWTVAVLDGAGATIGATVASFVGPFASGGVNALGPKLLDLDVIATAWTLNPGDGSWTSSARSQRA